MSEVASLRTFTTGNVAVTDVRFAGREHLSQKLRMRSHGLQPFTRQLKQTIIEKGVLCFSPGSMLAQKSHCHTVPWNRLLSADMKPLGPLSGYQPHCYHSKPLSAIWPLCISVQQYITTWLIGLHILFHYSSAQNPPPPPHIYLFASYTLSILRAAAPRVLSFANTLPSQKLRK